MKLRLRAVAVAAAAMLLAASLGACSSTTSPPGSGSSAATGAAIQQLTAGETAGYANLDPDQTQSCNDNFCGLFMEHLLQLGPNNTLEPELATSVSEPDPTTYIYHLRHGVKFWDGHEMTSADVVYSLNRTDLIAANGGALTATPQSTLIPPSQLQTLGTQTEVNAVLNGLLFAGHNYTELSTKYTLPPFSVYPAFSSWALHLKEKAS